MEQRYQIVFINDFDEGVDVEVIKKALVERFKLSGPIIQALLTKDATIVKDNLDGEMAATYKMAIDATGANCRIEPMAISAGTNIRERRRKSRRDEELEDRRKLKRTASIQPDRRKTSERRKVPI